MRSITVESFGETCKEERSTTLIRLTNSNGMKVELLSFGAAVRSIIVPDRDGKPVNVVLGFDTIREYETDRFNIGCTLGRVAGRIAKGEFALDSKEYVLACNAPPHHLDGGSKSPLSKKVWDYTLLEEGNGVVFTVRSHDGEEGYPGNVTIQLSYVLTNHNELLTQFSASTDKSTLLNLSHNIYFNLNGEGTSSLNGHEVSISPSSHMPRDENGLVTGKMENHECKFPVVLDYCSRLEDVSKIYCIDPATSKLGKKFRHLCRVTSSTTGIDLNITSTYPCAEFNTATQIPKDTVIRGKGGAEYRKGSAFSFNCRGFDNSINLPHLPQYVLRPDQLYQQLTIYRFSLVE